MRRFFLIASALGFIALSARSRPSQETGSIDRPNIIFVLIDDLRWDALGAAGHPFVRTPHIDRIAHEGLRLTRAFVSNPLCSPSRGTFLTGRYASTHGIIDNRERSEQSHHLPTFAPALQAAGYATAYVGKWHMGKDDSARPGWDHWVGFGGQGLHFDPELNFNGERRRVPGYTADILSDVAVDYIREPRGQPFLLYLSHKAVHAPYSPAERHADLYAAEPIAQNPAYFDDLAGKPAVTPNLTPELTDNMTTDDFVPQARNQLRMITSVDDGIGRIFEALAETDQLENTVFIFTSDNGYLWGEHGRRGKRLPYEDSIRVPLHVRYPEVISAGTVRDDLVSNVDLAPTFLELAGAPIDPAMQGRSLLPLWRGEDDSWRDMLYFEYIAEKHKADAPGWRAVRTPRWKYVSYTDRVGMDELYDMRADPWELTNLIREEELSGVMDELRARLRTYPVMTRQP